MRIQIVDSKRDFSKWEALLSKKDMFCEQVHNFVTSQESLEQRLEVSPPDVVLCHVSDLIMSSAHFEGAFIAKCSRKGARILLYSLGTVEVSKLGPATISVTLGTENFEIRECTPDLIRGCPRPIATESDLPIETAVAAISAGKISTIEGPAETFINALVGFDPILEASLILLYASLSPTELRKFVNSRDYHLLLGRIPADNAKIVEDNVAMLSSGAEERREALVREIRDALLQSD